MEDVTENHSDKTFQCYPLENSTSLRPDQCNHNKKRPLIPTAIQEDRKTLKVKLTQAKAKMSKTL